MRKSDRNAGTPLPEALGWADGLGIAVLAAIFLIFGYVRSRGCMFWADEIMGMLVLRQPHFSGVLHLWRAGVDSSGIWFYVLGRPWLAVFGSSETALRLFSASGIAASAAVLWVTARRYYSLLPVASSIPLVYLCTTALHWQLSNGRTYGLFLCGCSLAMYLLLRGESEDQRRPTARFLLATFAVHALLTGSHILGLLYSAAFLGMQGLLDLDARRFRPLLYVSVLLSWVVFLFSIPNIHSTMELGKPTFWTLPPTVRELVSSHQLLSRGVRALLLLLLCGALLKLRYRVARRPVYLLFIGFAALDVFLFLLSRHGTSIYVDRYLLPFTLIAVLIACELQQQIRDAEAPWRALRSAVPFAVLAATLVLLWHESKRPWPLPYRNYTNDLYAHLPPGLPVVDADTASFLELEYYKHSSGTHRLLFPDDRTVALDPMNAANVSGFNSVDNFTRLGLYPADIQPTSAVLQGLVGPDGRGSFVVISGVTDHGLWLDRNVLSDRRLTVTPIPFQALPGFADNVLLVEPRER